MTEFQHDNPYAAPEPVEEDTPDYDLRKIAGLYNRLGASMNRLVEFAVVEIILVILLSLHLVGIVSGKSSIYAQTGQICLLILILFIFFVIGLLYVYCASLTEEMTGALKYSWLITLLVVACALTVPVILWVISSMLWRKSERILRNAGIEIIDGRVNSTQITVEEDY